MLRALNCTVLRRRNWRRRAEVLEVGDDHELACIVANSGMSRERAG